MPHIYRTVPRFTHICYHILCIRWQAIFNQGWTCRTYLKLLFIKNMQICQKLFKVIVFYTLFLCSFLLFLTFKLIISIIRLTSPLPVLQWRYLGGEYYIHFIIIKYIKNKMHNPCKCASSAIQSWLAILFLNWQIRYLNSGCLYKETRFIVFIIN
jgi:hypothetical protein